ncbi:MAG: exo-alpha-sialidase, partial [Lentisphaerae bacterium]|nr:exo-alpha-sialidase [Lentisphaerota bacterium]
MKILAKKYIWNITPEVPRAGEGSAVLLQDGRIFLVYSRFLGGGADHSKAELLGGILSLQDGSLSEQRILFAAPEALNQMSVSLERLQDSSLGMVFIRKLTPNTDQIFFSRSTDEGQTWSEPVHCSQC